MADSVKTFLQDLARVSTVLCYLLIFLLQELTRKSFRFWGEVFVVFIGSFTCRFSFSSTLLRRLSIILHLPEAWESYLVSVSSIGTLVSLTPEPFFFKKLSILE